MCLPIHFPLKSNCCQAKSLVTGERKTSLPFSKKGRKKDPGNYRLVSFLTVSGKIMEQNLLLGHMQDEELRQSAQLHQGQIVPDQPGGLL